MKTLDTHKSSHSNSHYAPAFSRNANVNSFFSASPHATTNIDNPAPLLQAKLTIGQPGDQFEQAADTAAEQVVQRLSQPQTTTPIQRKCDDCQQDEQVQMKEENTLESTILPSQEYMGGGITTPTSNIQRQHNAASGFQAPSLESQLSSSKGSGSSLPSGTQSAMEGAFGADFGKVRIHTDSTAVQMNRDLGAKAFTHGQDIYFNAGNYAPESLGGKQLLAHELTHTIQQNPQNRTAASDPLNNTSGPTKTASLDIQRQGEEDAGENPQLTRSEEIALSRSSPGQITAVSSPFALSFFNFGVDRDQPKAEHQAVLVELARLLKTTTTAPIIVRVIGFASSVGDSIYNLKLSRRRAEAMRKKLLPGITQKISLSAFGETNPASTNDSVEGRSRNRRVDVRFFVNRPPSPKPPPRRKPDPPGVNPPPQPPRPPKPPKPPGPGEDDRDFCEEFPLLCGIGITPVLLPLICIIAPEICVAAACLLNPLGCLPPIPPTPPDRPDGPDGPERPDRPDSGTPPTVIFSPAVRAGNTPTGMFDRIGLRDPVTVTATVVTTDPLTSPIQIEVDGTGTERGVATVNGQNLISITSTTVLTIRGTQMSSNLPAFNPDLQLAAWWSDDLVGFSNQFAVSSLMENWTIEFEAQKVTSDGYAFWAKMDWVSDSGNPRNLDECYYVELVDVIEETGGFQGLGIGKTNKLAYDATGDLHPTYDQHGTEHGWTTNRLRRGTQRLKQLFRISDIRSNSDWAPSTKSGFEIERDFKRDPRNPRCWHLIVSKKGTDVRIQGMEAKAGRSIGTVRHEFRNIKCDPPPPVPPPTPVIPTPVSPTPPASTTDRYAIHLKAWIPHRKVVDPEESIRASSILSRYASLHPLNPIDVDFHSHYRGDRHRVYGGGYRVLSFASFDWDGSSISGFRHLGNYGRTHRDYRYDVYYQPLPLLPRVHLASRSGTESDRATRSTNGRRTASNAFELGMASTNPVIMTVAPDIDSDITGVFTMIHGRPHLVIRYNTDNFPSHGLAVYRNGSLLASVIIKNAAGGHVLGLSGMARISLGLTSQTNVGLAIIPL